MERLHAMRRWCCVSDKVEVGGETAHVDEVSGS